MESKKKEHPKGKVNLIHSSRPAGLASKSLGFLLDADFLSFLSETTANLDFMSFAETEEAQSNPKPTYTRLNVSTRQIPRSVINQILSKPNDYHYARPHFDKWKPNCSLFGVGRIALNTQLTNVRHLRIDDRYGSDIYIATTQNLNKIQAEECCHWFRTLMGWEQYSRFELEAEHSQFIRVPITYPDGTFPAKASVVDGPTLANPDFPTRAAFMIDAQVPGWELHTYNSEQINQIAPLIYDEAHPKAIYSQALKMAFKQLHEGELSDQEIAKNIAVHLSEPLPKYRDDPKLALQLGHQYVRTARLRNQNEKNCF